MSFFVFVFYPISFHSTDKHPFSSIYIPQKKIMLYGFEILQWTISLSSSLWVVEGLILSSGGQLSNTPGTICIVWIHWGLQAETRTSVLAKRPLCQFQQCFLIQCRRWEAGVLLLFLFGDGLGFYFSGWINSLWGWSTLQWGGRPEGWISGRLCRCRLRPAPSLTHIDCRLPANAE